MFLRSFSQGALTLRANKPFDGLKNPAGYRSILVAASDTLALFAGRLGIIQSRPQTERISVDDRLPRLIDVTGIDGKA